MARTTHAQQLVKKLWGHELIIENDEEKNYCLKILHINANRFFSWQFHKNKTEVLYVTKGIATIYYGRTPREKEAELLKLKVGESIKIYPYQWHRVINTNIHEPLEIMECSTFHEDSDTYRNPEDWKDTTPCVKQS